MNVIRVFVIGIAVVCIGLFSFNNTYPKRVKILGTIVAIVIAIYGFKAMKRSL